MSKKEFHENNRKQIIKGLADDRAVTVLFAGAPKVKSADQFFAFEPNRNFYYMTGIDKPLIIYMSVKDGDDIKETLFIERYDELKAKWDGKIFQEDDVKALSGITDIKFLDEFENTFKNIVFKNFIYNIYLDLENRYLETDKPALDFADKIRTCYPQASIKNVYSDIASKRLIKEDHEIETLRKSIDITRKGIENILSNTEPNIKEYELEACFDYEIKKGGAKDKAFNTILASGKNATTLHYGENNCDIKDGDLILIDLGASYNYYSADISRTFPANGVYTERQKELYNIVLAGQQKVMEAIKPAVPYKRLNEIIIEHYEEELVRIGLIEDKKDVSKYYFHNIGHYLGLDTHDVCKEEKDMLLEAGMVITVEPGLYIAEESIGIRIEDDVLVTADGYENLSKDIIKTTDEIEAFIKNNKK